MKSLTKISVAAFIASTGLNQEVNAAGGSVFNYAQNGADWKNSYPKCGASNQSPIDLKTNANAYKRYDQSEDLFTKTYANQKGDVKIGWTGSTTKVALDDGPNMFMSNLASSVFGANKQFNGAQFHFHAGSEHTVDGKRHDFEMHTVHTAQTVENDFKYAAMGLMFSVNDYTAKLSYAEQKIIDTFFETLDLTNQNDPKVNLVTYGDLMMMADMNNRWVYKGSVTTPPCDTYVYWNVLTTVYPISQKHLDQFKAQLQRGENGQLANRGNWRLIQPVDLHNVIRVSDTKLGSDLMSSNAPKYEININIYNQNTPSGNGGSCY